MIILFTDFGLNGPYLGQVKSVIHAAAPDTPVVDLFADAPAFDPRASAYLLAAYAPALPKESVVVAVVDPGVGSDRLAIAVRADERWYLGPDNGLLAVACRRSEQVEAWRITWQPERLSASFHGRDLFAPVAAQLSTGAAPPGQPIDSNAIVGSDWPEDLPAVIYVDVYGNVMTGLRASQLDWQCKLQVSEKRLNRVRTFSDVPAGQAFWYENSNGLAEIAVNQGSASQDLALEVGDPVEIVQGAATTST